jgi:hypothetical protein
MGLGIGGEGHSGVGLVAAAVGGSGLWDPSEYALLRWEVGSFCKM